MRAMYYKGIFAVYFPELNDVSVFFGTTNYRQTSDHLGNKKGHKSETNSLQLDIL